MVRWVGPREKTLQDETLRPVWQQEGPASDELNPKQLGKGIFIDLLIVAQGWFSGKVFPHTKVLSNLCVSFKENITYSRL